jgi:hypothetical protein
MYAAAPNPKPYRPSTSPLPTIVRRPADSGLFRGWGPTL